jgi:hypothetical protein
MYRIRNVEHFLRLLRDEYLPSYSDAARTMDLLPCHMRPSDVLVALLRDVVDGAGGRELADAYLAGRRFTALRSHPQQQQQPPSSDRPPTVSSSETVFLLHSVYRYVKDHLFGCYRLPDEDERRMHRAVAEFHENKDRIEKLFASRMTELLQAHWWDRDAAPLLHELARLHAETSLCCVVAYECLLVSWLPLDDRLRAQLFGAVSSSLADRDGDSGQSLAAASQQDMRELCKHKKQCIREWFEQGKVGDCLSSSLSQRRVSLRVETIQDCYCLLVHHIKVKCAAVYGTYEQMVARERNGDDDARYKVVVDHCVI